MSVKGDREAGVRANLEASLRSALAELQPAELVQPHLPEDPPALIVAVGKAALPMLSGARLAFPATPWIATPPLGQVGAAAGVRDRGAAVTERGRSVTERDSAAAEGANGLLAPGAHPLPDAHSVAAADLVLERVASLGADESLLLLVSGGGSSLWCAPSGVGLEEKRAVVDRLLRAGADIFELNCVRKHLSRIKGGRLAAHTTGRILSLIISDVPGDDAAVVASGVAAPDATTFADALDVLDKFGIDAPGARAHFRRGVRGEVPDNPKPADPLWERVESRVIGSNRLLLEAAKGYWERQGIPAVILSDRWVGEARDVARAHAEVIEFLRAGGRLDELADRFPLARGPVGSGDGPALQGHSLAQQGGGGSVVLLSGGETTVTVRGSGRGGRNQEFALWLLHYLGEEGVWAISAGSDGIDGNSEAAGAILRPDSWVRAGALGLDPSDFLARNDSYSFFSALGDSVVTGHTGNNLNDYRAVLVDVRASGRP